MSTNAAHATSDSTKVGATAEMSSGSLRRGIARPMNSNDTLQSTPAKVRYSKLRHSETTKWSVSSHPNRQLDIGISSTKLVSQTTEVP